MKRHSLMIHIYLNLCNILAVGKYF